jgi:hypothetical protein
MKGHRRNKGRKSHKSPATLYQFVCTPLQNKLNLRDQQIIIWQGGIKRLPYGGLQTQVLPLQHTQAQQFIQNDLLFQNTLALVTLSPQPQHGYKIQQTFLSIVDGKMNVIAQNNIS